MSEEIDKLFIKLCDKDESDAYLYADKLAKINSDEVMQRLIDILKDNDIEDAYLAARALSKMERRQEALDMLLEVIHDKKNQHHNGGLVEMLENFDLSEKFVDIFRIYLFGNFKASLLAKNFLDTEEFNMSPRMLRKAEKHWNHFCHNSNPNEGYFQVKSIEAQEIINEIKEILTD